MKKEAGSLEGDSKGRQSVQGNVLGQEWGQSAAPLSPLNLEFFLACPDAASTQTSYWETRGIGTHPILVPGDLDCWDSSAATQPPLAEGVPAGCSV